MSSTKLIEVTADDIKIGISMSLLFNIFITLFLGRGQLWDSIVLKIFKHMHSPLF